MTVEILTCKEYFDKYHDSDTGRALVQICLKYTEEHTEPGDGTDRNWFPEKASKEFWDEHWIGWVTNYLLPSPFPWMGR